MNIIAHGGRLDETIERYGGKYEDWLDLSTGINPQAYPVDRISDHVWQRLPGRDAEIIMTEASTTAFAFGVISIGTAEQQRHHNMHDSISSRNDDVTLK